MIHSFQQQLTKITFKTFYHNQVETFGYDNLFANQRVIVFSLPQLRTSESFDQLNGFISLYSWFTNNGIDDVYAVNSVDWLIGPWMDKRTNDIKGLADCETKFVETLAQYHGYDSVGVNELAMHWQYMVIINNGILEKLWYNPYKTGTLLKILKDSSYRYRKLSAEVVQKYLVDNPT